MGSHRSAPRPLRVVVANPSADVYGSDLQLLESVRALIAAGYAVTVLIPESGALVAKLTAVGAGVRHARFPVLRRANASPWSFLTMVLAGIVAVPTGAWWLRRLRADLLYVNTVTLPWWLLVGRITRTPTVCHVHEAETTDRLLVRRALLAPLRLADRLVIISRAVLEATCGVVPSLRPSCRLVYNGVPFPPDPNQPPPDSGRRRLAVIGRLSPRKGTDLALEVAAELVRRGHDVELEVAGSSFAGYEAFEDDLRARAARADLEGRVRFSGYCSPIWPVLARNEVVLAPSLREPFGNAVVEAMLAQRVVIASDELGHKESLRNGETGYLVPVGEVIPMADAAERVLADPAAARVMAERAARDARERFSTARYDQEIVRVVTETAARDRLAGPSERR